MDQSIRGARDELLRAIQLLDSQDSFEQLFNLVREYGTRYGNDVLVTFLNDQLDSTEGRLRIFTAYAVLTTDRRVLSQKRAIEALEQALAKGPIDDRLQAAWFLLYTSGVTERAVPALSDLASKVAKDDPRRIWVFGAIYRAANPEGPYEESRHEAMWQLLGTLRQEHDPGTVLAAAIAMRDDQIHAKQVSSYLLKASKHATGQDRLAIIGQLGKIGGDQSSVVKTLLSLVESSSEPSEIRLAAIQSLAYATVSKKEIDKVLMQAMADQDRNIVLHAASALHHRGGLPPEAVKLLHSYLSHPVPDFRGMAALCLIDNPPGLLEAIPLLIQRLELEEDKEIADTVITALGQAGTAAIQPIVNAMALAEPHRLVRYQYALREASKGTPDLIAHLIATEDRVVGNAAAQVLGEMGPVAAPAVPILNDLLASSNPDHVQDALIALRFIGPIAAPCAESLVRLLSHEVEEIRLWAESTLLHIGPVVVPALVAWQDNHPDNNPPALKRILQQLSPLPMQVAADRGVDGVRSENDLELFFHIAQLLIEHGPLGSRPLSTMLEACGLECSYRTISVVIERLEKQWSEHTGQPVRLIDRGTKRKGGLTPDGQRYARLAGSYLEWLRAPRDGSR